METVDNEQLKTLEVNELIENRSKLTPVAKVVPEQREVLTDTEPEISRQCAVMGCEESKNLESSLFFKFPTDPDIRQIWTDLTGRSNWTPNDYSYMCVVHFSVDSFICDEDNQMILTCKAIPSLQLPKHVLEVEYIDEYALQTDTEIEDEAYAMETDYDGFDSGQLNGDTQRKLYPNRVNIELLKLFTEVQKMQRQAVGLKDKLKCNTKLYLRQKKYLQRLKEIIVSKEALLKHKKKKKLYENLPLLDKLQEDKNDLVVAMPTKHTDDLKNFALSVYKYSPQAYIYIRNALRTMLPSTNVLEDWIHSGYQPRNVMSSSNLIKVVSEQTESELTCKICLH